MESMKTQKLWVMNEGMISELIYFITWMGGVELRHSVAYMYFMTWMEGVIDLRATVGVPKGVYVYAAGFRDGRRGERIVLFFFCSAERPGAPPSMASMS